MSTTRQNSLEVDDAKSLLAKRSIIVNGKKTSASIEEPFWIALREIASVKKVSLSVLVSSIDRQRQHGNLSSCIRLFVLEFYRTAEFARTSKGISELS
jgi:predicted DNA-binding ribbon-helix-helix protein